LMLVEFGSLKQDCLSSGLEIDALKNNCLVTGVVASE
jgi:hypothetical protein